MTRANWLTPGDVRFDEAQALPRERRRFTGAMLLSALVHALVLALLIGLWAPAPEESAKAPIPVNLRAGDGASGAAGGGNTDTAASSVNAPSAADNTAPPQPDAAQTALAEPTAAQVAPTPTAAPPTPALPSQAESPPPTEIADEPLPPRKPTPPHPPQAAAPVRAPPPPLQATAPAGPATPTPSATATATASNDAIARPGDGGRGRGDEGAGRAAIGDGSREGPGDDYLDQVQRWVARFKQYPDEARTKKQEGTAAIGFKFARDGTVVDAWIEKSSGFPLLDDAALKMIHAASPIPKVPDKYHGDTLTLTMPERFKIGVFDRLFH